MNSAIANTEPLALDLRLPWEVDAAQEEKFHRLLKRFLIPLLLFMLVVPWLPVFDLSYEEKTSEEVVTTVMLEPLPEEIPPPAPPKPAPSRAAKLKPTFDATPEQPRPSPKMAQKKKPQTKQDSVNALKQSQGLNELSNQLAALRGSMDVKRLQSRNLTKSTLGEAKQSSREFLGTDGAVKRSDGIEVDDAMLSDASDGLAEYQASNVDGLGLGDSPVSTLASYASLKKGQRDFESIRRVMDRIKHGAYSSYQQALQHDSELAGKIIFKLVIEPDGSVRHVSIVASELGIPELEKHILDRIRAADFGAKEVVATPVEYTYVFIPS